MATDQHGKKVQCVLCLTSEENRTTGPLSTKGSITAHQNCLLYSSGIICKNSPEFDDLFGFSVEDVLNELKRGNRLNCYRCKKKGATVGCEVKRCKKSYHYPCALRDGAQNVDDHTEEKFTLYCLKHNLAMAATNETVSRALSTNGDSDTTMNNNGETSPKSLQKERKGLDAVAGPSSSHSDSNMSSKRRQKQTPKRRLSCSSTPEVKSSKKSRMWSKRIQNGFSDSDGVVNGIDMELAPLESDLEDSVLSEHRNHAEALTGGCQPEPEHSDDSDGDDSDGDDTVIDSSQSLLLPVMWCVVSEETSQDTNLSVCSSQPCSAASPGSPVLSGRQGSSLTPGPISPVLSGRQGSSLTPGPISSVLSGRQGSSLTPGPISSVLSGRQGSSLTPGPISSVLSGRQGSSLTPGPISPVLSGRQGSSLTPGPISPVLSGRQGSSLTPGPISSVLSGRQGSSLTPGPISSVLSGRQGSSLTPGPISPVLSGRQGSSLTPGPISSVHSGPLNVTNTPTRTSPPVSPVPPDCCFTPVSSPHSVSNHPLAGPGGLGSPIGSGSDSAASRVFWRRCNEAGCTQSIFTTFFSDMVSISNRILSDNASQEDYDLSLRVMEASGKLSQMLSEQEREFKKKQMELQSATAAIRDARSALKR
ncbi:mucin-5AC-like isoform X2 [Oncorhynchus masou masou]|uniref:mucin-5AC-like isoform X2 n=1 Tax=Oncorhynchus masou masou TaxID=90313 RepID=UPI0031835ECE